MINRDQIVDQLARELRLSRTDVEKIVKGVLMKISDKLKEGESVNFAGFGEFYTKIRGARAGVNPRNPSEKIHVPAVRVPKFKPGLHLKKAVKE